MHVMAYRTALVQPGDSLEKVITEAIPALPERSLVIVASKIVSTCENRFVPKVTGDRAEKHALVRQEAELYVEPSESKYDIMLTIKNNWMFANAGIDESNAQDKYLLWPSDPQQSVTDIWHFLRQHYGVKELGVTLSDSRAMPLNWGVVGHSIAYCGFNPLRSYIGQPDLFGRPLKMEQVNIAQSLTALASVEMGEGNEQTPLAVLSDITNIEFQDHAPTAAELAALKIDLVDDVFAPLLTKADWKKGGQAPSQ